MLWAIYMKLIFLYNLVGGVGIVDGGNNGNGGTGVNEGNGGNGNTGVNGGNGNPGNTVNELGLGMSGTSRLATPITVLSLCTVLMFTLLMLA